MLSAAGTISSNVTGILADDDDPVILRIIGDGHAVAS